MSNAVAQETSVSSSKSPIKIVNVEDNSGDVLLLQHSLRYLDVEFSLRVFNNGFEAMRFVEDPNEIPELIILDLNLPFYSGWDILKAIKERPQFKDATVMIFSTSDSPFEIARSKKEGVLYFHKPIDFDGYLETVNAIVKAVRNA